MTDGCVIQNIDDKTCQLANDLHCTTSSVTDMSFTIAVSSDDPIRINVQFGFEIDITWNNDAVVTLSWVTTFLTPCVNGWR